MPGRRHICELLGRQGTPMAAQPDDKRAGGRVESRNSAALIGRDPEIPTEVRQLNLHVRSTCPPPPVPFLHTASTIVSIFFNLGLFINCYPQQEKQFF